MLRFLRVLPAFRHLPLISLAWLAGACAGPERSSRSDSPPAPPRPPAPYTRVAHPNSNTVALQIAIRKFTPTRGPGPAVWLTGVSHVGQSNYFAVLQRHLDEQSLVLFEGVGAKDRPVRFDPDEGASVQHTLAKSLGLVFQLTAIDYERAHFRNSDLGVADLQRLLAGESTSHDGDGSGGSRSTRELDELVGVMNGTSLTGMLVHLGIQFLGSSPKLQAMAKLALIEVLGQFQGDLAEAKGIPPEIQRLMAVLIRSRNDVVFGDLKKHLAEPSPAQSISIFYGAAHMTDLERRLTNELGYRVRREDWLTVLSVDTQAAGLTAVELETVRGLVRWQLEALR